MNFKCLKELGAEHKMGIESKPSRWRPCNSSMISRLLLIENRRPQEDKPGTSDYANATTQAESHAFIIISYQTCSCEKYYYTESDIGKTQFRNNQPTDTNFNVNT